MKAILFDLDGTLMDTSEGVIKSAIFAARALGFDELPYEVMKTFIGPPMQESFIKYYKCDKKIAQEAANVFRDYYLKNATTVATVYDGIYELLRIIRERKIKIAVATYKREDIALKMLNHFKIDSFCNVIHGADNNNILSKSDVVNMCLNEIGVDKKDVVLVGDTLHDAKGAYESGIDFIAALYGLGFVAESDICCYPYIGAIKKPIELLEYIRGD